MKLPESSMRSARVWPDGRPANEPESAGTADTVGIAILAVAGTSLPAKSRLKYPALRTTAAMPNS